MTQDPWTAPPTAPTTPASSADPARSILGDGWVSPSAPPWRSEDPTLTGRPATGSPFGSASPGAPPTPPPAHPPAFAPVPPPPAAGPPSPPRTAGGGWRVATALLAATTVFAGGFALRGVVDDDAVTTSTTSANKGTTVPVDLSSDEPAAEVARVLGPAVVQIERGDGLGSGVIYDASGLILTNAHVVGDARSVDVRLADGTLLEGRVLGGDEGRDLAVVAVDATGDLPVAELALGEELTVGQVAVAVGSPFGLQQSVTMGIVSATDRPVEGSEVLIGMVQTDAPINPGNSGGALADRSGRVIGVNASIYSEDGENNGIGFAIPIDVAVETARRIVEGESLDVARIGVESDTAGPSDGSPGALVGKVRSGGAADDAGISEGDIIVGVEDQAVISFEDLAVKIGAHFPGDTISVEVKTDGKVRTVEVTLGTD